MNDVNFEKKPKKFTLVLILIGVVLVLAASYFVYKTFVEKKATGNDNNSIINNEKDNDDNNIINNEKDNDETVKLTADQFKVIAENLIQAEGTDFATLTEQQKFYTIIKLSILDTDQPNNYQVNQTIPLSEIQSIAKKYFGITNYTYIQDDEFFNYDATNEGYTILQAIGFGEGPIAIYTVKNLVYNSNNFTFELLVDWQGEADNYSYTVTGTCDTANCIVDKMVK